MGGSVSVRKKFFLIFVFIILDMFLLIGFLVIRNATMLNDLKHEADTLKDTNLTQGSINMKPKTRGNYREVEMAMKKYLNDCSTSLRDALQVVEDERLTKILSYDNYKNDGKEFKKSLSYLEETKKEFNKNINKAISMTREESIKEYGKKNIIDSYYYELYKKYMLNDKIKKNLAEVNTVGVDMKKRLNNIFDTSTLVLNFLVKNQKDWKLEDNEIKFKTDSLYTEYTRLIKKLNNN